MFSNLVLPSYAKYVAAGILTLVVWIHGYVTGLEKGYKEILVDNVTVVTKQGKVTEKVITKYITKYEKQNKKDVDIIYEGKSFPIKFPDAGSVNSEFARVFNSSVTGEISPLSSGESPDSARVSDIEGE
jgi:hypothetical protein